jgi:hypothetical protein
MGLLAAVTLRSEVIDRVAVAVDNQVITMSAIEERVRVAAFLARQPVDLGPASRRRMAERLIEQTLVQREMEMSRYASPEVQEVDNMLEQMRQRRGMNEKQFADQLVEYGLTEAALRQNLSIQVATIRFVDVRFRPGSAVTDGEIELYYRETFAQEFQRNNSGKAPPELDDVRDRIEQILLMQKANQGLEIWLKDARGQARVRFFEEAFQ